MPLLHTFENELATTHTKTLSVPLGIPVLEWDPTKESPCVLRALRASVVGVRNRTAMT
jgi:hypothetical protein